MAESEDDGELREVTKTLIEYVTVLRRHVSEQEGINRRLTQLAEGHEQRIVALEKWRAVLEATMPREWLNPHEIHSAISALRHAQAGLEKQISRLILRGAVALTIGIVALQIVVPKLGYLALYLLGGK